jgi:hypothetical protein
MELTCTHGEPRGPRACALCRHAGRVARDEAVRAVKDHADGRWFAASVRVVRELAGRQATITADEVLAVVEADGWSTNDNRAMGGVMKHCQSLGLIAITDQFEPSANKRKHASPTRVWRSLVVAPQIGLFDGQEIRNR